MRRRNSRRVQTLQAVVAPTTTTLTGAGLPSFIQTVFPMYSLLGSNTGASNYAGAKLTKDVLIHGIDVYSDWLNQGGTNGNSLWLAESLYVSEVNSAGTPVQNAAYVMNENEWTAVTNPVLVPDRIFYRRQIVLDQGAGFSASSSNGWMPVHSRLKRKLSQTDALVHQLDYQCQNTGFTAAYGALIIVHFEIQL